MKQSGFETWLGSLYCCVLGQDTLVSHCLPLHEAVQMGTNWWSTMIISMWKKYSAVNLYIHSFFLLRSKKRADLLSTNVAVCLQRNVHTFFCTSSNLPATISTPSELSPFLNTSILLFWLSTNDCILLESDGFVRPLERSSGRTIPLRVQEADLRSSSLSVINSGIKGTASLII